MDGATFTWKLYHLITLYFHTSVFKETEHIWFWSNTIFIKSNNVFEINILKDWIIFKYLFQDFLNLKK
jgi:hypothetical protein